MQAHIATALTPPVLVGIASIVVAITLALVGWIVVHRSAEARELRKEQRARQHAHEIARKRLRGRLDSHIEQISNHLHGNVSSRSTCGSAITITSWHALPNRTS